MVMIGKLGDHGKSYTYTEPASKVKSVRYDYLEIGSNHIRDVVTSSYLDNFLIRNRGQVVALSYVEENIGKYIGKFTLSDNVKGSNMVILGIKDAKGTIVTDEPYASVISGRSGTMSSLARLAMVLALGVLAIVSVLGFDHHDLSVSGNVDIILAALFAIFLYWIVRRREASAKNHRAKVPQQELRSVTV